MTRRGWTITIGVGALVLAVVLVSALLVGLSRQDERARTPADAVRTYLTALSGADASAALAVVAPRPDARFLTDGVLRQQRAEAPISDIEVDDPGESAQTVRARYRLGSREVDTSIRVTRAGDGWAVVDGAVKVRIESLLVPGPTLFGAQVKAGDTVHLFPGPQRWGSRDTDFVGRPTDDPPTGPHAPMTVMVVAELSPTGVSAVSDAVSAQLTRCAASTRADAGTDMPGCTQRLFRSAADGSVRWTAPRDLSGLRYLLRSPDASNDATPSEKDLGTVDVAGAVEWRVAYTPDYDRDGPRVETTDIQYLVGEVDLTADTPSFTAEPVS
ncbi:hypothetical protein RVF83_16680 [Gordonia rubripertincta]|uniref:Uncharacterized protein n=2 Tax=Gordonia rubripertincta TaxID=36822 RepID=A0AAW6RE30_GORRU|nr:hypothetical protein [Gordonia rubripertincta]MDG6782503.1 hypothetical protein [Gordonia rubripertincta]NKY64821.1 hypothetical protein [Gordonia rubripertincta]GAB85589.1 hypothetical protein GORBP_062_00220 [Gordonia rubripertincta NBRC 101908]